MPFSSNVLYYPCSFFFECYGCHRDLHSFPTRRSSDLELRGLEQDKFNQALNKVIARHGMLRAIVTDDGMQQILPEVPAYHAQFHVTQNDNEFQQLCLSLRDTMSHQMIDCSRWPLFEIAGVVDHDNKTRLHVSIDLLVADAWSLELFMRELAWFYHHPQETLPDITYSFRDYVQTLKSYEQTPQYERAREYWRERVQTMPSGPRLTLLVDQIGRASCRERV